MGGLRHVSWNGNRRNLDTKILISIAAATGLIAVTLLAIPVTFFGRGLDGSELGTLALFFGLPTAISNVLAAWFCMKKKREQSDATFTSLFNGIMAGFLNILFIFLSLIIIGYFSRINHHSTTTEDLIIPLVYSWVPAIFVGCPLGLLFGIILLKPLCFACTHPQAHETPERTGLVLSGWLCLISGLCTLAMNFAYISGSQPHAGGALLIMLSMSLMVYSAYLYTQYKYKIRNRKKWLERVKQGQEPDWAIASIQELNSDEKLRPLLIDHENDSAKNVLLRFAPGVKEGAYRSNKDMVPFALVNSSDL